MGQPAATTVFFGGGTPSLLRGEQLMRILDAIDRADGAEVTVECNPDSVDAAKFAAFRAGGVNRLSFGVQSMVPHVLAALGRTHDPANVRRAVMLARDAGFERVNLDLIYGTPGESPADWQRSLDGALELGVDHVSVYALTVEPATALGRQVAAGAPAPDDDLQADAYLRADDVLSAAGLEWYEVSNWARPGQECRHNELYWTGGEYAGIGCAAHGHTGGRRWWTFRTPERYIAAVNGNVTTVAGFEDLDAADPRRGGVLARAAHPGRCDRARRRRGGRGARGRRDPRSIGAADRPDGPGPAAGVGRDRPAAHRRCRGRRRPVIIRPDRARAGCGRPARLALGTIEC